MTVATLSAGGAAAGGQRVATWRQSPESGEEICLSVSAEACESLGNPLGADSDPLCSLTLQRKLLFTYACDLVTWMKYVLPCTVMSCVITA